MGEKNASAGGRESMVDRAISLALGAMYRACELAEWGDVGMSDWSVDFRAVRAEVKATLTKEFPDAD